MRIRTFQNVDLKGKYADLVDWRALLKTSKSDQKNSSPKVNRQRAGSKKPKQGGVSYDEEESE